MLGRLADRVGIGRLKIWGSRLQTYLALLQFLMVGWLTFKGMLSVGLVLAGAAAMSLVMWLDITYVMPRENSYFWRKTPDRVEMAADVKEIKAILKKEFGNG